MKKILFTLIACLTLFSSPTIMAETVTKNDVRLRDEVILDLLSPAIYKAIDNHFGKPKQYYCSKILQINEKREHETYTYYEVTVQLTTFEGAHVFPFDLVTITFSNKYTVDWHAVHVKSRRLEKNEITECREPK
ncbi:DUF3888 domain-containing protein [Robertmurraya kyonggiensis]|uniref:DUF3888 domain-containing protein n=1 Tax=Robertmurraya kyonggiensis TaxID=1037680 RepID=A0A4U1DAL4_9BACI|nr:DUF3888 domain-containing protein [Robertmurraya kyonggiensis]TKC19619.1 DUF3888 domain-containing protein [Robertmurraya kyonggiensis]